MAYSNDLFANAIEVFGNSGSITPVGYGGLGGIATSETGESVLGSGQTLWWKWTSPYTATAEFNTVGSVDGAGSGLNTIMQVFITDFTLANRVASNDDFVGLTSTCTFSAVAGTKYYIQVDQYGGAQEGAIHLSWLPYVAPVQHWLYDFAQGTNTAIGYLSIYNPMNAAAAYTYDVDWGDGSAHTAGSESYFTQPSHAYPGYGPYTVTLITDLGGTETRNITINAPVTQAIIQNSGSAVAPFVNIPKDYYFISDSVPTSYDIDWGDGSAHTTFTNDYGGDSRSHTWTAPGNYTIHLTCVNTYGTGYGDLFITVSVPRINSRPSGAIALTEKCGVLGLGNLADVPPLLPPYPDGLASVQEIGVQYAHLLFYRYTASATHVLEITVVDAAEYQNVAVWTGDGSIAIQACTYVNAQPYNTMVIGFPIEEGHIYLIGVGRGNTTSPGAIGFSWGYQQRALTGPVVYVLYGFANAKVIEAVSIADPAQIETIAWQGGVDYANSPAAVGTGVHFTNDGSSSPFNSLNSGPVQDIANGVWKAPVPSVFTSASPAYPGLGTNRRGFYLIKGPSGDLLATFKDSIDNTATDLWVAGRTGAAQVWPFPTGEGFNAAVYAGSPHFRFTYPNYYGGQFDESGHFWNIGNEVYYDWNGNDSYDLTAPAIDHDIYRWDLSGSTPVLLGSSNVFSQAGDAPGARILGFSLVGSKVVICYELTSYNQYSGGVFIRVLERDGTFVDDFEFRPYPVLPRPAGNAGGSEAGWRSYEFYLIGFLCADPTDSNYFFMTNNAHRTSDNTYWSFIFRIPIADPTNGDRYNSMRNAWAAWQNHTGGEIGYVITGELAISSTPSCAAAAIVAFDKNFGAGQAAKPKGIGFGLFPEPEASRARSAGFGTLVPPA